MSLVITSMFFGIRQSSYWPNSCKHTTPAAAIAVLGCPPPFIYVNRPGSCC